MPETQGRSGVSGWKFAIRALNSRNYRLFFGGQGLSLVGTWMTRVATSWLVYRLTGSSVLLGTVSFCGQIPILFLSPFAGVWLDRLDRHRVLVVTQVLSMFQSFALAALAFSGHINIPWLIGLSLFQGIVNSFDNPARQAFVVEMVENREDLPNGIALNSSLVNGARLVGPSIAGLIIAATNESVCFLIDGISYMAVIGSLLAMHVVRKDRAPHTKSVIAELVEGWNYIRDSKAISSILLMLALVSLVGMPYTVLMPMFAGGMLHGGPHTLGFMMGAVGVGALSAAVSLAARRSVLGLGTVIVASTSAFGAGLIAFSFSRHLWLSLPLLVITGFGMICQLAAGNTITQTIVANEKRGRVMSFFNIAFQGITPVGSLIAGFTAAVIGAPYTLAVGGLLCLIGSALFRARLPLIREEVRPIYQELGILPIVAAEVQAATTLQAVPVRKSVQEQ